MLKIRGMDIYYIRGDDDSFSIQPTTEDGTAVTGYSGVFSVKRSYDDTDYVLQYCQRWLLLTRLRPPARQTCSS
nr:MAG TPA: hypothetical protein [Caudoviricetes sp.]